MNLSLRAHNKLNQSFELVLERNEKKTAGIFGLGDRLKCFLEAKNRFISFSKFLENDICLILSCKKGKEGE